MNLTAIRDTSAYVRQEALFLRPLLTDRKSVV